MSRGEAGRARRRSGRFRARNRRGLGHEEVAVAISLWVGDEGAEGGGDLGDSGQGAKFELAAVVDEDAGLEGLGLGQPLRPGRMA